MADYRLIPKSLGETEGVPKGADLKTISCNLVWHADEAIDRNNVRDRKRKDDLKNAMTNDQEDLLFDLKKYQLPDLACEVTDTTLELIFRTALKRER